MARASVTKEEAIEDFSLALSSLSLKALIKDKTGSTMKEELTEAGQGEFSRDLTTGELARDREHK